MNKNQQEALVDLLSKLESYAWSAGHHESCIRQYVAQADEWKRVGNAEHLKIRLEWIISERKAADEAQQNIADTKAKILEICHD